MPAPAWSFRNHWMAHTATHARMRPDKRALRYRGESVTWAQLSRRSLQLAAGLAERGISAGDRVALLTLNHPWFVESVLAANSIGAIAVPLSFRLAPLEIDYILHGIGSARSLTSASGTCDSGSSAGGRARQRRDPPGDGREVPPCAQRRGIRSD